MALAEKEMIAERVYTSGPDGKPVVTIQIGRPREVESGYHQCDWAFVGEPEDFTGWAAGVDSVSALDAALWMIGSRLEIINEQVFHGQLRWAASTESQPLGLPVIRGENDLRANYG